MVSFRELDYTVEFGLFTNKFFEIFLESCGITFITYL